jgi:hypothetical protein
MWAVFANLLMPASFAIEIWQTFFIFLAFLNVKKKRERKKCKEHAHAHTNRQIGWKINSQNKSLAFAIGSVKWFYFFQPRQFPVPCTAKLFKGKAGELREGAIKLKERSNVLKHYTFIHILDTVRSMSFMRNVVNTAVFFFVVFLCFLFVCVFFLRCPFKTQSEKAAQLPIYYMAATLFLLVK